MIVNETEVFFEPEEEGSYRAIMMHGQDEKVLEKISKGIMQAIPENIKKVPA